MKQTLAGRCHWMHLFVRHRLNGLRVDIAGLQGQTGAGRPGLASFTSASCRGGANPAEQPAARQQRRM